MKQHEVDIELGYAAECLASCFARGGKVLICGNGGSASTSSHVAADFVGRLSPTDNVFLPATALTDPAIMSAIANDYGYDRVFSWQVNVYGKPGDVLLVFTTSGASKNIVAACDMAINHKHMEVIAFCGKETDSSCHDFTTRDFFCDSDIVQSIQEWHLRVAHQLCCLSKNFYNAGYNSRKSGGLRP